jgi:hypothetical protein
LSVCPKPRMATAAKARITKRATVRFGIAEPLQP